MAMVFKQEFDTLLTKKMDRKDFLKHVIVGIVSLTGIAALIRTMSAMNTVGGVSTKVTRKSGYGRAGYGSKHESS